MTEDGAGMTEQPLAGRVALVTGGANGIGRACALRLAVLGARVAVMDLGCDPTGQGGSAEPAESVAAEARASGGQARAFFADVSDSERVAAAIDEVRASLGEPAIAVTAAGIMRNRMIFNMTDDEWSTVLDVHLFGTLNVFRAVLPGMRAAGFGRVVTFTSSAGLYGVTGAANYAAAKACVEALTRVAADEYAASGVLVNTIAPHAPTRLGAHAAVNPSGAAWRDRANSELQRREGVPLPADRSPEAIANVVAALTMPACRVTGECLLVAGEQVTIVPPWRRRQVVVGPPDASPNLDYWAPVLGP